MKQEYITPSLTTDLSDFELNSLINPHRASLLIPPSALDNLSHKTSDIQQLQSQLAQLEFAQYQHSDQVGDQPELASTSQRVSGLSRGQQPDRRDSEEKKKKRKSPSHSKRKNS